jgi:hypothetical protein
MGNPEYTTPARFYVVPPPPPLTNFEGDANITILEPTPLSPYLIDPTSELAHSFPFSGWIEDTGLNFGAREFTKKQAAFESINTMSMMYGYHEDYEPNVSVFEVTCAVSDFLMEDDTPIFNAFSLRLNTSYRGVAGWVYSAYVDSAGTYESKDELDLAKDEPVVAMRTDAIGDVIINYIGILRLEANNIAQIGDANATITWDIGFAVEP